MPTSIAQLNFGYNDASQYLHGRDKDFFNRYFHRTPQIEDIKDPKKYFLFGEKGTGKTALAVFASNGNLQDLRGRLLDLSVTEYKKFIELKRREKLEYSDYSAIWRVILLVLMSQHIRQEMAVWDKALNLTAYNRLNRAIDSFFAGAFTPEVAYALEIVNARSNAATFKGKLADANVSESLSEKENIQGLTLSLMGIERELRNAISEVRVRATHVIFIDGIDQRPSDIYYKDYKACIDGLLVAAWSLNHDFFSQEKRIRGKMKVMLLCRPDIIYQSGISNAGTKITDNGVALNWVTNDQEGIVSPLYGFVSHILGCQQNETADDWIQLYWPLADRRSVFNHMLRLTWQRPRDFVTILRIIRENRVSKITNGPPDAFTWEDVRASAFSRKFSEYMLSEAKDFAIYYMDSQEFDLFIAFFQNLNGNTTFDWPYFVNAYQRFMKRVKQRLGAIPQIGGGAEAFLQFLYDMNIVAFKESTRENVDFVHWAYRERSPAELRPRVKPNTVYEVHPGIARSLNLGRPLKERGLSGP